jgi:hypothetical protein
VGQGSPFVVMTDRESEARSNRRQTGDRVLSELKNAAYSSYESCGETAEQETGADFVVTQVTAALRDTVAAVDQLKLARRILVELSKSNERSQEMSEKFQVASAAVAAAIKSSPALLSRNDLELFSRKRFLVTAESSLNASVVVRKSELWLKELVREIGKDLVAARREAMRVSLVDSVP